MASPFSLLAGYKTADSPSKIAKEKGTCDVASPFRMSSSGGPLRSPPANCAVDPSIRNFVGTDGVLDVLQEGCVNLASVLLVIARRFPWTDITYGHPSETCAAYLCGIR